MATSRPMKYRKIEEILAFQLTSNNGKDVAYWCGGRYFGQTKNGTALTEEQVKIPTLEGGPLAAKVGDYVAKNEDGSFRVIPQSDFESLGFQPFHHRTRAAEASSDS